jgi:hypothetical protein
MKRNVLGGRRFVLGIQSAWDAYEEVEVEFIRRIDLKEEAYHLFSVLTSGRRYWLKPLFEGHSIEGVVAESEVDVNVFDVEAASPTQAEFAGGLIASGVLRRAS